MKFTMTYSFGDVVLVDFPFSSNVGIKKRPAVVVSSETFNKSKEDLILLAITSQIDNLTLGEALVNNWQEAGLLKPSAFKSVVFTVEKQYVYKTLGKLSAYDKNILVDCLKQILSLLNSLS